MDDIQIKPADQSNPSPQKPIQPIQQDGASISMASSDSSAKSKTPVNTHAYNLVTDTGEDEQTVMQPETFIIPKLVQEKYSDLINLIKNTESMDDEEKQYWFQILPIMTVEQVGKLKTILNSEKEQLQSLDREYEEELQKLNEKHLIEWKEFESKEKNQAIKTAETKSVKEEQKTEEELLAKLNDV